MNTKTKTLLTLLMTLCLILCFSCGIFAADLEIGSLEDLQAFAADVDGGNNYAGKTVALTADIDASSVTWNPIGAYTSTSDYAAFAGTFEGNGHTVTMNAVDSTASGYGFIAVNEGVVSNLIIDGTVSGKSYVGGIVGRNSGTISDCVNKADISATMMTVGGITGHSKNATIVNCVNEGTVNGNGTTYTGGIIGWGQIETTITGCCNRGAVNSTKSYTGGIAGNAMGVTIDSCYNTAAVTSTVTTGKSIGGVVGYFTGTAFLKNCYNVGQVSGGAATGAITGTGVETQLINNYYLEGSADFASASISLENGKKTETEMKTQDFVSLLNGDESAFVFQKDAYPILAWEEATHEHHYGDWKSDGADTHSKECACGDKVTENHHWDEGEVTKEPTETGEGVKTYCCTVCGETKTEAIAPVDPEPTDPEPVEMPFTDVSEGQWFYPDVAFVYERNLFNGVEATLFCPDATMTRGMFVTVLGRLEGIDATQYTEMPFTDVKENLYYAGYIGWAAENGIVKGVTETTFAPDSLVSRQDIAVLLSRYAEFKSIILTEKVPAKTFTDNDKIGAYAGDAVSALQQADILNGYENGSFDPLKSATRAEVAKIFHCFIENFID